jgi:acyl-CoA thioesterase FadM
LRELDFARVDFYERTGLYKLISAKGGTIFQSATTIRYRKIIATFSVFEITTKIIYWDDKSVYMEHKFIGRVGFVHAVVIGRQRVVKVSVEEIMKILVTRAISTRMMENGDLANPKPDMSLEVS